MTFMFKYIEKKGDFMNSDLCMLLSFYFSSVISSSVFNTYMASKNHISSKKKAMRKLKFKDGLNYRTKRELNVIKRENGWYLLSNIGHSLIPLNNIFFTCENILLDDVMKDYVLDLYSQIVNDANKQEEQVRKMNLDFLKSIREKIDKVPEDISLDSENLVSDLEVKKILKLNKLNYDIEMLKYEKENDIKY